MEVKGRVNGRRKIDKLAKGRKQSGWALEGQPERNVGKEGGIDTGQVDS